MCIVLDQFVDNKTSRVLTHEQFSLSGYWISEYFIGSCVLRFKTIMILLNAVKIPEDVD